MLEPEVAFSDLVDNMDLAENMLKYVIKYVMDKHADDLAFLEHERLNSSSFWLKIS